MQRARNWERMEKSDAPGSEQQRTDRLKAIALTLLAVTMFACLDGTAKYLVSVELLPVGQIVWMRFFGHLLLVAVVLGFVSIPRLLRTHKLKYQLARSLLMLSATLLNVIALRYLRLDQTTTILFLAPLTVALLAGPTLGEWVGWRRLVAILVGFMGILIAIRPGISAVHPAFLLCLGGMLSYSLYILMTRYLAAHDTSEVTLFYSTVVGTIFAAPWALSEWVWPTGPLGWILLLSLGFWGGASHYVFIVAHRWAPTSALAPFLYGQLLAATAIGYFVFDQLPDVWTITGAGIIVASGIYMLHRERIVKREDVED
ncbi:MAG TPA: DMT family transporter [Hyphomicrobiaceae bacterium]